MLAIDTSWRGAAPPPSNTQGFTRTNDQIRRTSRIAASRDALRTQPTTRSRREAVVWQQQQQHTSMRILRGTAQRTGTDGAHARPRTPLNEHIRGRAVRHSERSHTDRLTTRSIAPAVSRHAVLPFVPSPLHPHLSPRPLRCPSAQTRTLPPPPHIPSQGKPEDQMWPLLSSLSQDSSPPPPSKTRHWQKWNLVGTNWADPPWNLCDSLFLLSLCTRTAESYDHTLETLTGTRGDDPENSLGRPPWTLETKENNCKNLHEGAKGLHFGMSSLKRLREDCPRT